MRVERSEHDNKRRLHADVLPRSRLDCERKGARSDLLHREPERQHVADLRRRQKVAFDMRHWNAEAIDGVKTRRSEEHTSELQSRRDLVCRLLLAKKKK